jgi:hypothetical protein
MKEAWDPNPDIQWRDEEEKAAYRAELSQTNPDHFREHPGAAGIAARRASKNSNDGLSSRQIALDAGMGAAIASISRKDAPPFVGNAAQIAASAAGGDRDTSVLAAVRGVLKAIKLQPVADKNNVGGDSKNVWGGIVSADKAAIYAAQAVEYGGAGTQSMHRAAVLVAGSAAQTTWEAINPSKARAKGLSAAVAAVSDKHES